MVSSFATLMPFKQSANPRSSTRHQPSLSIGTPDVEPPRLSTHESRLESWMRSLQSGMTSESSCSTSAFGRRSTSMPSARSCRNSRPSVSASSSPAFALQDHRTNWTSFARLPIAMLRPLSRVRNFRSSRM